MNPLHEFRETVQSNILRLGEDLDLKALSRIWIRETATHGYVYNFRWLGVPIIQLPQDIVAVQEVIWNVKPDLIIETGIAHGGSLILSASLMQLLGEGRVIGLDIDIREHNRKVIEAHPLSHRIDMIEGSSIDEAVVREVHELAANANRVMVILDSCHSHEHVLAELHAYSDLVRQGSYILAMDTGIEDAPQSQFADRPWGKGDNPRTAVWEFLKSNDRFEIDTDYNHKLLITSNIDGYLKCVKD